ncbi:MAG: hypothetical protein RKR03_13345 [Candidatus Competibacter sp.]|nr:hypothetical protein [Candidatus Competibacter sp.]
MPQATLILNERDDLPNGVIIAQRIHRLTESTAAAPHGYVYQLHCGTRTGQTLYTFTTLARLLTDFEAAIQPYLTED